MKKKLNEESVINELREGSAFFKKSQSPASKEAEIEESHPSPPPDETIVEEKEQREPKTYERTDDRTNVRTSESTNVRKEKRVKIRHAFDIFEDQLRALHTLQLKAVQAGRTKPKLGEMVQKAIDMFLENEQDGQREM